MPGVRVDADEAGDLDLDAGLLQRLSHGRGRCGLADLLAAAGQRPQTVVAALDEQHTASVVLNERGHADDEAVGLRR